MNPFDAVITITGLIVVVMSGSENPQKVELLLVDTHGTPEAHRHAPVMVFPYESRGIVDPEDAGLPGWNSHVMGPDGLAYTRIDLSGLLARFVVEGGAASFTTKDSMSMLPDLKKLGVNKLNGPGVDLSVPGATSRIALPPGTLSMKGIVTDDDAKPIEWKDVGIIAERLELSLVGITRLTLDYGAGRFDLLGPGDGRTLEVGISNDPWKLVVAGPDEEGVTTVPHYQMFSALVDPAPKLQRDGGVTPSNPICTKGKWVDPNWAFYDGGE